VSLSRGGADANVVREFDMETRTFIEDGFRLPEAKGGVSWIDQDHIYVSTDFGPGSMTTSGYPRISRLWTRGTPLAAATTVYEGKPTDMSVSAFFDDTPGFERHLVVRGIAFYKSELFLRNEDGTLVKVEVPEDANAGLHREWMTVELRTSWTVGGRTYPAGALLAARFDDFMKGGRDFEVLFEPTPQSSLAGRRGRGTTRFSTSWRT
jgi:prolyl oligopeptidase